MKKGAHRAPFLTLICLFRFQDTERPNLKRLILLTLALVLLTSCTPNHEAEIALAGRTMGTTYSVKIIKPIDSELDTDSLQDAIDQALINVNALMSTYDPNSELSLLNQAPSGQAFEISDQTEVVIQEAIRLAKLSDGVLDVTVGPLVNLWGFGPDKRPESIPSPQQLLNARQFVGIDKFVLKDSAITKLHRDVYIDLSTIAKGYGVDVVASIIETVGINAYLVEIGGEMRVKGAKPNGQSWRIAVEKPVTSERAIQRIVSIGDNAIATSGDYRNYYEQEGVRYSHLIDPNTGYPIDHNLVSVTVVHPSSMIADGLATALNVMGPEKAKLLAEKENLSVLLITKEGDEFVEYKSPEFEKQVIVY